MKIAIISEWCIMAKFWVAYLMSKKIVDCLMATFWVDYLMAKIWGRLSNGYLICEIIKRINSSR